MGKRLETDYRDGARTRRAGVNGVQSLFTAKGPLSHVQIECAWAPAVDYGRRSHTDEPLTHDGHPMAAPIHNSQAAEVHLGGNFVQTGDGTRRLRNETALRYTDAIPLEDHITES